MERLESIQFGRGIAALSVLIFHISILSVEYLNGRFYSPWLQIFRAGVDVFFVISGVVMVLTTYQRFGNAGVTKRFLLQRVSRIYPPYLFLTALLTVFWILHPNAVNAKHGGVDLFSSYTLWPSSKLPLVPVAWSLSYEMMFYLVFAAIIAIVSKKFFVHALVAWGVVVSIGYVVCFPKIEFLCSPYVLEFIVGCFIGLLIEKRRIRSGRSCAFLGVFLFVLSALILQKSTIVEHISRLDVQVLLFGTPAVLLVFGMIAWEQTHSHFHVPRLAKLCGDASYSIYLVHILILHAFFRYAWHFFGVHALTFITVAAASSFAAGLLFYFAIERPLSAWTRFQVNRLLIGGRREETVETSRSVEFCLDCKSRKWCKIYNDLNASKWSVGGPSKVVSHML